MQGLLKKRRQVDPVCEQMYVKINNKGELEVSILYQIQLENEWIGQQTESVGHREYTQDLWEVKIKHNGKEEQVVMHKGEGHYGEEPKVKEVIYSILLDAFCYERSADVEDFMDELGYDDKEKAEAVYNTCQDNHKKLHSLFSDEEIEELDQLLRNY